MTDRERDEIVTAAMQQALLGARAAANRGIGDFGESVARHALALAIPPDSIVVRAEGLKRIEAAMKKVRHFAHPGWNNSRMCGLKDSDDPKELCMSCLFGPLIEWLAKALKEPAK